LIRVVVISDIRIYREGLARSLGDAESIAVAGTASAADEAMRLITAGKVDTALLDMTGDDSLALVRSIAALAPHVKIVALAMPDGDRHVIAGAEAGVAGYVTREASLDELVATVQSVANGEMPCSARVAAALARRLASVVSARAADPSGELTAREREVLQLMGDGHSNKEIAQRLCIEVATVKNHVHNILGKLQVVRRGQAVALGKARELI
jgi:two-component system nitrate/nitrite response regulator NarL